MHHQLSPMLMLDLRRPRKKKKESHHWTPELDRELRSATVPRSSRKRSRGFSKKERETAADSRSENTILEDCTSIQHLQQENSHKSICKTFLYVSTSLNVMIPALHPSTLPLPPPPAPYCYLQHLQGLSLSTEIHKLFCKLPTTSHARCVSHQSDLSV